MAVPSGSRIAASVLLPPALPIVTWPCPPPYDLRRTLESGQAFRWRWDGDAAVCVVAGRVSRVRQEGSVLRAETADPAALRRFLVVDAPLREIETALARDPVLRRVLPHTSGIAILRQEPWECLVSYIISAFNNIPKIQQTIERLSRRFGRRLAGGAWAFPTPPRLARARETALRSCLLGYRAPYVRAAARLVLAGAVDLERLRTLPVKEARGALLALPGVGEKVADCVLLFGLGHHQAFPVDVWVKRAVERLYFGGRRQTERAIRAFAGERFGPLAGYAQQHLFAYARARMRLPAARRRT